MYITASRVEAEHHVRFGAGYDNYFLVLPWRFKKKGMCSTSLADATIMRTVATCPVSEAGPVHGRCDRILVSCGLPVLVQACYLCVSDYQIRQHLYQHRDL